MPNSAVVTVKIGYVPTPVLQPSLVMSRLMPEISNNSWAILVLPRDKASMRPYRVTDISVREPYRAGDERERRRNRREDGRYLFTTVRYDPVRTMSLSHEAQPRGLVRLETPGPPDATRSLVCMSEYAGIRPEEWFVRTHGHGAPKPPPILAARGPTRLDSLRIRRSNTRSSPSKTVPASTAPPEPEVMGDPYFGSLSRGLCEVCSTLQAIGTSLRDRAIERCCE